MIYCFSSSFGLALLEGEVGAFAYPHQWYKPLQVVSAPKELCISQEVLGWPLSRTDQVPSYKHVLENELYRLEGCYIDDGMLYVDHVTGLH